MQDPLSPAPDATDPGSISNRDDDSNSRTGPADPTLVPATESDAPSTPPKSSATERVNRTLGQYELLDLLGQGGKNDPGQATLTELNEELRMKN